MIYKGDRYQISKSLGYRMAKEGDKYLPESPDSEPEQIKSNYVVIVKIKDCETREEMEPFGFDGEEHPVLIYNSDNAPAIPCTGHSRTNLVYTPTHAYLVEDGQVYSRRLNKRI